jgi:hypothetical protein
MNSDTLIQDYRSRQAVTHDASPDSDWYQAMSQLCQSMGLAAHDGRILITFDLAELKRKLPTSTLIGMLAGPSMAGPGLAAAPTTPNATDLRYQAWLALPLHAQLAEVSAALSLNKTQLAEVLHVSRPTIYQWMDEQRTMADDRTDTTRLTTLLRLMAQVGISGTASLNARFTKVPLQIHGRGLLALLFEETWDEARVLAALTQARDLTRAAQQARADREARLKAEGFTMPTADERAANLERNLFLEGLDNP